MVYQRACKSCNAADVWVCGWRACGTIPVMRHRHLNHEEYSPAAIDDILERGDVATWRELARALADDPFGEVAQATARILEHRHYYGSTMLWKTLLAQLQRERAAASR